MKQNLQRSISMTFRVNEEERDLIYKAMKLSGVKSLRAYLLKMAVNGRIFHVELDSVREMNRLLGNATNNINQIAKGVNETGRVHAPDLDEIKARQDEIRV